MSWLAKTVFVVPVCWEVPGKEDIIDSLREELWKIRSGMNKRAATIREEGNKKRGEAITLVARGRIADAKNALTLHCNFLFHSEQIIRGINLADQLYRASEPQKVIEKDQFVFCQEVFNVVCQIFMNEPTRELFDWVIDELIRMRISKGEEEIKKQNWGEKKISNPYNPDFILKQIIK